MATIKSYNKRLLNLRTERSSFIPTWQELSDYHLAHRGRFLTSDRNKGYKRNTKQQNNHSRLALRTLASGMMAGITSPARPWFRLGTADRELKDNPAVKEWLHEVQTIIYSVFSKSNVYNTLHTVYAELGCFGTACMGLFEDFDDVVRGKVYTVGSYMLATNGKDEVDTFYREYELRVAQLVSEFGIDNVSQPVRQQFESGNTEAWVKLVHVIEPNDKRDHNSPMARDKKYRSVYYERGGQTQSADMFLLRSGFDDFPILAPRWDVTGEDIYATDCPGMTALGDTKVLQLGERRSFQAIDKVVNPPLQGPSSLRNKVGTSLRSGDIIWLDATGQGLKSVYDFRPDLAAMEVKIEKAEQRVSRAFYEDLFLMLANSDRRQITAREVAEKHEEKLLMLGPVLERLQNELLDPLIDRTFNLLNEGGVFPPAPDELLNQELRVEYISVLAQAQQLVSIGGIERVTGFVESLAQVWPEARHKIDAFEAIDSYSNAVGTPPEIVRSDSDAAQLVQQDQQAAAAQQQAEQQQQQAQTMQQLSKTDTTGENALANMVQSAGLS